MGRFAGSTWGRRTRAKAFYSGLFGWEMDDLPAGDSDTYTICQLGGLDITGMREHSPRRVPGGAPISLSTTSTRQPMGHGLGPRS